MNEGTLGSLYIEMFFNDLRVAMGTGFIVLIEDNPYLITNRHNFTGKSEDTNIIFHEKGCIPNKVKIYHHKNNRVGKEWVEKFEYLYDDNELLLDPLWIEHPTVKADVVALKLTNISDICCNHYPVESVKNNLILNPSESLSIIGFPFGKNSGANSNQYLPIWVNGFISSEPDIDVNGLPMFYIDCRAREGQSGSPVIALRNGIHQLKGNNILTLNNYIELLGIYSGRISEKSDIGKVWKLSVIKELVAYIKGEIK